MMFRRPSLSLLFVLLIAVQALGWWGREVPHLFRLAPMSADEVLHSELGGDFRFFWAAGHLVSIGQPLAAYRAEAMAAQDSLRELRPEQGVGAQPLLYPPFVLPVLGALGALPYAEAWLVYEGASLMLLALAVLLAFPRQLWALPVAAGFGGLWSALNFGQNTVALTALYLLIMACAPLKEMRMGALLALASFKPHLGVVMPLWLVLRRHFLAAFVALLGVAALVGWTGHSYGWEIWTAYGEAMRYATNRLQAFGTVRPVSMISLYASLRQFGVEVWPALAAQGALALLALWGLLRVCRDALDPHKPLAAAILVTLLAMPHCYAYDLVLLLIPLLVMLKTSFERGWRLGDVEVLLPLYILPFYIKFINAATHLPVMPLLLLWALYHLVQQTREHG